MNPNHNVFVIFTTQLAFGNATATPIIDALLSYPNMNLNYLNLIEYAEKTPLSEWMKTDKLNKSKHKTAHTADVLRFLTLWKYSGT